MTGAFWLTGVDAHTKKVRLAIKRSLLIGRGSVNHVVLKNHHISRQHARIAIEADGFVVYDLGSTNGTFVNGVAVSRQVLHLHDELRFGWLAFRITAAESEGLEGHVVTDLETPTRRDLGSVSKMMAAAPSSRSSLLPVVDLRQMEDAYSKLGTLYSFVQAISQTIDGGELIRLIGNKTREIYRIASGVGVYLAAGEDIAGAFRLVHFAGRGAEPPTWLPEDVLSDLSAGGILTLRSYGHTSSGTSMYAPLIDHNETIGVIHVTAGARSEGFSRADLDLLAGMAAPAAMMLRNAKSRQESARRDRLKYDLELAAQIQRSFLPREVDSFEGVDLLAEYRAAYSVGGDFYDVLWVAPDRLAIFIGDIAGKGVAGALLMAQIATEMRFAALAHVDPALVLGAMNKALIARNRPDLFFTAVYLTLDVRSGEVVLANAGHPAPYCKRADGALDEISEGAAGAVGIVDDPQFEETVLRLGVGDTLVLYTDGVVEASAANGAAYGSDRLTGVLEQADARPDDIVARILASVDAHLADVPANDDLTLFMCRRSGGVPASIHPRRRSGMQNSSHTVPHQVLAAQSLPEASGIAGHRREGPAANRS